MFKEKPAHILLICILITICTGVLQYLNPGVVLFDYSWIIAVVMTVFIKNDLYTKLFGALGFCLILVSGFYTYENVKWHLVFIQHSFPGGILILTSLAVLYIKTLYADIESDDRQVKAILEHAMDECRNVF